MSRTTIARVLAAILLVTSAPGASAYLPGQGGPIGGQPAPMPGAPTQFRESAVCTPEQNRVIEQAFAEAQRRVARAIAFIDANPNHPHMRTWFGETAKPSYVRNGLMRIAEAMRPGRRPTVYCGTAACMVFGRAWPQQNTISLCTRFFKAGNEGTDARYGVIIHEISHIVIGTRDHAYGPPNARALAQRDPVLAANNADNFEYFVETLPGTGRRTGS
jgi:hypothetical protein